MGIKGKGVGEGEGEEGEEEKEGRRQKENDLAVRGREEKRREAGNGRLAGGVKRIPEMEEREVSQRKGGLQ